LSNASFPIIQGQSVITGTQTSVPPTVSLEHKPTTSIWWYWVPPLAWIGLIFFMSTDVFSSAHTGVWLLRAMRVLHISMQHFRFLHTVLRKGGHFAGYFVLSILFFRAWRVSVPGPARPLWPPAVLRDVHVPIAPLWTVRWSSLAVVASAVAAALDEFHQSFVPSRTASWHDVALDTMGAIFAQIIVMLFLLDRWREGGS
jgi:VanZ family protein